MSIGVSAFWNQALHFTGNCTRTALFQTLFVCSIIAGTCNEDEFACYDFNKQECIPQSFKCDGKNDCADGKDELVACRFDCADGKQTIHLLAKCNFRKDCSDGSDEVDCDWGRL